MSSATSSSCACLARGTGRCASSPSGERSFRLATLDGHLEAGRSSFALSGGDPIRFEIESWARSADRLADLLYDRVRMAKEVQLHMWISFLEGAAEVAGGRMTGGWRSRLDTRAGSAGDRRSGHRAASVRQVIGVPDIERRLARWRIHRSTTTPVPWTWRRPPPGWNVDRRCQPLPAEPPGEPIADGSWEVAGRLIRGYEFADPSVVRAHYDPDRPLDGREMLLELRALGLVRIYVGVRVVGVYDEQRHVEGRMARVFGWAYRTLTGHLEEGQMDWQVWKWLDTGEVAVPRSRRLAHRAHRQPGGADRLLGAAQPRASGLPGQHEPADACPDRACAGERGPRRARPRGQPGPDGAPPAWGRSGTRAVGAKCGTRAARRRLRARKARASRCRSGSGDETRGGEGSLRVARRQCSSPRARSGPSSTGGRSAPASAPPRRPIWTASSTRRCSMDRSCACGSATSTGRVVYSDDGSGFGVRPENEVLEAARGKTGVLLTHVNDDSGDDGPAGVPLGGGLPAARPPAHSAGASACWRSICPMRRSPTTSSAGLHGLYLESGPGAGRAVSAAASPSPCR